MPTAPDADTPTPEEEVTYTMPTAEELAALLPQYEIHRIIGQGGMGIVYLGRQPALDRLVAIKLMPALGAGYEEFSSRFVTEARAMAKLVHPHIVSVFDFGQTQEGHLYFVMEYVEGSNIHQLIRERKLTEDRIKSLAAQLCDALQYAHDHGVAHRDIKPANLLVTSDWQLKVADFGLAKQLLSGAAADDNEYGTPDYSAPERFSPGAPTDHRADIFAVGVVLHEMLTGMTPAAAQSAGSKPALHPMYASIISRCLLAEPAQRFQHAKDIRTLLQSTHTAPAPAATTYRPPIRTQSPPPPPAPRRNSTETFAAIGLALLVGSADIFWLKNRPSAESDAPESLTAESAPAVPPSSPTPPSTTAEPTAPTSETIEPSRPLPAWIVPDGPPGEIGQLVGHTNSINAVAILPDQGRIISASSDGTVRIWDPKELRQLQFIRSKLEMISRATLSPDGTKFAMASLRGQVEVIDLTAGSSILSEPVGQSLPLSGLHFSPDGKSLLLTCFQIGDGIYAWPTDGSQPLPERLDGWDHGIFDLAFLPGNNDEFVTVGALRRAPGDPAGPVQREAGIGSLSAKKMTSRLAAEKLPGNNLQFSKGGTLLAICMPDILLLDGSDGSRYKRLTGPGGFHRAKFLDGDRLLLSHGTDTSAKLWDIDKGESVLQLTAEGHSFVNLAISTSERWAVSGGFFAPRKQGDPPDHDPSHFPLRLWRLPDLSTVGTDRGGERRAPGQPQNLAELDPEVAAFQKAALAEVPVPDSAAINAQLQDLNAKYSAALDRSLPGATPGDATEISAEKDRLTINAPLPADDNDVGPTVRRFRQIYRLQLQQLEGIRNTAAAEAAIAFRKLAAPLLQQRTAANDLAGADRIRATEKRIAQALSLTEVLNPTPADNDPARGIRSLTE